MPWKKQLGITGATLICSLMTAAAEAVIVIDDFSDVAGPSPWPVVQTVVGSVTTLESGLTGVLGGVRDTTTTLESVTVPGVDSMHTSIVPGAGMILDYASSAGADGELELLYDGGGLLHADFSQELSILLGFGAFDLAFGAPLPVTITLSDGTSTASLTQSLTSAGSGILTFEIGDFAGVGGVDLTDVTSVSVQLDPGTAADYRLTSITTVTIPAPGVFALLVVGGLIGVRRRR